MCYIKATSYRCAIRWAEMDKIKCTAIKSYISSPNCTVFSIQSNRSLQCYLCFLCLFSFRFNNNSSVNTRKIVCTFSYRCELTIKAIYCVCVYACHISTFFPFAQENGGIIEIISGCKTVKCIIVTAVFFLEWMLNAFRKDEGRKKN